jgi:hypothetical protein
MNRLRASLKWLGGDPLVVNALSVARASLNLDPNYQPIVTTELVDVETGPAPDNGEVQVEPVPPVQPAPVQNQNNQQN